ncbi:hypothetical protein HDU67_006542 [Dinochytrium kinnereticum]|nr:hypothetical protein HDU67_006542 [Dinochytrium kinnereticum]
MYVKEEEAGDERAVGGMAFTYGRTRSILAENEFEKSAGESYSTILRRNRDEGLDSSDSEGDATVMKKDLKGIHELREAGELKRFSDEMEYIISGLDRNLAVNVRRSSFIELLRKSSKPAFSSKLKTFDLASKLNRHLENEEDPIIIAIIASQIIVLGDATYQRYDLPGLLNSLCYGIRIDTDPFKDVRSSKYEKLLVSELKALILSLDLLEDNVLSLRNLSLSALALILSCIDERDAFQTCFSLGLNVELCRTITGAAQNFQNETLSENVSEPQAITELTLAIDILGLLVLHSEEGLEYISNNHVLFESLLNIFAAFAGIDSQGILADLTARGSRVYLSKNMPLLRGITSASAVVLGRFLTETALNPPREEKLNAIDCASQLSIVLLINVLYTIEGSGVYFWESARPSGAQNSVVWLAGDFTILQACAEIFKLEFIGKQNDDLSRKTYLAMLAGSLMECRSKDNELNEDPGWKAEKDLTDGILSTLLSFLEPTDEGSNAQLRFEVPRAALDRLKRVTDFLKQSHL